MQFFDEKGKGTTVLDDKKTLTFKIFTWGRNPNTGVYKSLKTNSDILDNQVYDFITKGIKVKSFKSNYYGYIEIY